MSLRHLLIASASVLCLSQAVFAADAVVATPPATATDATATTMAAPAAKGDNAPVTRAELPGLVREALLAHPEMLTDAIKVLHDKQLETASKETQAGLSKYHDELFNDTSSPSIGPKDADVTFVEFFDYHCGYCKHLLPTIQQLTKDDKKVRIIFREFPILSPDSVLAARAAIAVNKVAPDKYFAFHTELMKSSTKFDDKQLSDLAKKLGVDAKKFKTAYEDKATTDELDKNRELAEALGIRGTPALVFPDKMLPGALSYDDLQHVVDNERHGIKDSAPAK